jgi:hypothetical protein
MTDMTDGMDLRLLKNYAHSLVNRCFKILPMKEKDESSLQSYLESLDRELEGCRSLAEAINFDPALTSLMCIIRFLKDHPECPVGDVKREVFKAISLCNKLTSLIDEEISDEGGDL